MKRTFLALLISLLLHGSVIVAVYGWKEEALTPKSERISLRLSTLGIQTKEQTTPLEQTPEVAMPAPISRVNNDIKPLPKKREKITSKQRSTVTSMDETNVVLESNTTALAENTPLKSNTLTSFEPEPTKQTYLQLYGHEIRALIEKNKEYPELARKRALSDAVEVSFILTPSGDIEELHAASKYKILSTSAMETIHKAKAFFPKPLEDVTIKIPIIYVIK